jgi:thioredoxin
MKNYSSEEVLGLIESGQKVVIDFYANWCNPCRQFLPTFEKVSQKEEFSNVTFYKCNVDEDSILTNKYGVRSIPTIVLVENGEEKNKKIGMMSETEFSNFLS